MHNRTTAEKSEAALPATKARRVPAPAHSPNLSPNDFFLFGMLKEPMSRTYSSPDELISTISELNASLPKDQLASVYKNWITCINRMIKHQAEYYRK
jgi:hypothetical protein